MPHLRCPNPPSSARLFIQLSMRRPAAQPLLELLVPLPLRPTSTATSGAKRLHHRLSAPRLLTNPNLPRQYSARNALQPSRPGNGLRSSPCLFSTTPATRATAVIHNPQVDEDGKEMNMEITPRAAKRLSEIMTKDSNPQLALRIQVESGGCHGFQYLMKLVTLPKTLQDAGATGAPEDSEVREDDTIFAYAADGSATAADLTAPKIVLDGPSLELLKGSKVDFTMELIGSQFKIVDNPLATSSCGCGTSFDIKV